MGIPRINSERQASEQTPVTIVQKIMVEPVKVAAKKYWETNPTEFLWWIIFGLMMLLTFLGMFLNRISFRGIIIVYAAWVLVYPTKFIPIIKKKINRKQGKR